MIGSDTSSDNAKGKQALNPAEPDLLAVLRGTEADLIVFVTLQGQLFRITFCTVRREADQEHCEMTGRMPALNQTLQAMLASDNDDLTQLVPEAQADLQIMLRIMRSSDCVSLRCIQAD